MTMTRIWNSALTRAASGEELRATWKRLMRENHPDSLASRGVPPDFMPAPATRWPGSTPPGTASSGSAVCEAAASPAVAAGGPAAGFQPPSPADHRSAEPQPG